MAAPIGNNYNKKWKTPEERKAACEAFCEHVESGLSLKCWEGASWPTVQAYIEEFPEDFIPQRIEEAFRKQMLFWERVGRDGATGANPDFNATAWIFNMKNRFREDWNDTIKQEQTGKDGGPIEQNVTINVKFVEPLKLTE